MFEAILEAIEAADRIILHRHSRPDGDALGSQAGLYGLLAANYPDKELFLVGDMTARYAFIPALVGKSAMDDIGDDVYNGALAILLDTPSRAMVSDERFFKASVTARIDHHIFCEPLAAHEVIAPETESCCGLVTAFAMEAGWTLTPGAASALFAGMVTDSGRFRYDCTTVDTFKRAAFLRSFFSDTEAIFSALYADELSRVQLRASYVMKIRTASPAVAYITTTKEELVASGADPFTVSRGMVGVMSDIKGIKVWVNFTETEEGVLAELRSSDYNINPVAVKYGGGGHEKASGATLPDFAAAHAMLADLVALTASGGPAAAGATAAVGASPAVGGVAVSTATADGVTAASATAANAATARFPKLDVMRAILDKIKAYRRIIIMRHFRPDGDAVGSTKGLASILRATYPDKEIYLQNDDFAAYLTFMGGEDAPLPDEAYADALGIVVDTGTVVRMSNKRFSLCKEVVKIDHHIDDSPYGDISWVEETRSSACEMIVAFYDAFRDELVMTPEAAAALYTGMVTDSGRFRYEVSPETLRLASLLLEQGVDTETLFAHLYLKDFHVLLTNGKLMKNVRMTENGVAYLWISKATREKLGLTVEEAANTVSLLESIKDCLIWLAFIEYDDGSIRVRLRSRFVAVQPLGIAHHGGGHEKASGATCYSRAEMRRLIAEADALLKDYKATHGGWL